MENLEQYIKDHRREFEEEPSAGHFERFLQKQGKKPRRVISTARWGIAAAASLLLLLSIGIVWQHNNRSAGNNLVTVVCEDSDDIKHCYLDKMNDVAIHIQELTKDFDEVDQEAVMQEVNSIIIANDDLDHDIPEELPEETAKSILSDYYQRNLESLRLIAQSLEKK